MTAQEIMDAEGCLIFGARMPVPLGVPWYAVANAENLLVQPGTAVVPVGEASRAEAESYANRYDRPRILDVPYFYKVIAE